MTDFVIHVQIEPPRIRDHSQIRMAGGELTFWDPNFQTVQRDKQITQIQPLDQPRIVNRNLCTDGGGGGGEPQRPESGIVWP